MQVIKELTMRRIGLIAAVVLAAAIVPTAAAVPPAREPVPSPVDEIIPAGLKCSFPLGVQLLTNREKSLTFANGSQLVTGTLKLRLTNADTGESLDVNASGPGRLTVDGDLLHVKQLGGSLQIIGVAEAGGPGAIFTNGHVVYDIDLTTGHSLFLDVRGRLVNLCDELA